MIAIDLELPRPYRLRVALHGLPTVFVPARTLSGAREAWLALRDGAGLEPGDVVSAAVWNACGEQVASVSWGGRLWTVPPPGFASSEAEEIVLKPAGWPAETEG